MWYYDEDQNVCDEVIYLSIWNEHFATYSSAIFAIYYHHVHDLAIEEIFEDDTSTPEEKKYEMRASGMISIVFAALSFEALINRIGIKSFNKNYFNKHLEKLDPLSKWIVIPKLLFGLSIHDKDIYGKLQKLFSYRNKIVHTKSYKIKKNEEGQVSFSHKAREFHEAVFTGFEAVKATPKLLKEFDEEKESFIIELIENMTKELVIDKEIFYAFRGKVI